MKHVLILIAAATLAACTTTPQVAGGDAGRDSFAVQERPGGFELTVNYSRYQFVPETQAVLAACRASLLSTAHEVAATKGRQIQPVDEQRIRIATGRNGLTGMTSCQAWAPIAWKS